MTTDLDLRKAYTEGELAHLPVDGNTRVWANVVKPIAIFVFVLLALLVAAPFLTLPFIEGLSAHERAEYLMRWSTTVLPILAGFGSTTMAYYFGTRLKT